MSLKGKMLNKGAAEGPCREMALTLAKEGCNLIINDLEPMKDEAVKQLGD